MSPLNPPFPHLRIARPVGQLQRSVELYVQGLGLHVLGRFDNHEGFDGCMLGLPGAAYHLEFTQCRHHPVVPQPTAEDLLVLYLPDSEAWEAACARVLAAGFQSVPAFNPYWDQRGRSFADPDGYRLVLQCAAWQNALPA